MGGFIKRDVQRVETMPINQQINREVFNAFKDYCKELGYPMNVMIETFMQQYGKGRFYISSNDILKWKNNSSKTDTLSAAFNKEIYLEFKVTCKANGFFIRHVITAFMEKFASRNFVLEYINVEDTKLK